MKFKIILYFLFMCSFSLFAQEQNLVKMSKSIHNISLKKPQSIEKSYKYLPHLNKYMYTEKIGEKDLVTPIFLSEQEYKKQFLKERTQSYFKQKHKAITAITSDEETQKLQRDLLPEFYVKSEIFESIFGGQNIDIIPQGSVAFDLGMLYNSSDNPFVTIENRRNYTLDFDQKINLGLTGNVGTRLKVNAMYDTQSTFDFQNVFKLEYTPNEDDIVRKIEVGNVSLPLSGTLINGAQSLFGVKTQLQFGRTTITGVFSSQRSESKTIQSESSGTVKDFEIRILDYDENQNYFLSQFFRDNYDNALQNYPFIRSKVQITRIEVWATNRSNRTSNIRNIVALQDLGEALAQNTRLKNNAPAGFFKGSIANRPTNQANDFDPMRIGKGGLLNEKIRDVATVKSGFGAISNLVNEGFDYSILENAQKLEEGKDYKVNRQLGYISLSSRLNNDEILAVAYQYIYEGNVYQVGEFANDGISATTSTSGNNAITNNALILKMLKSNRVNTSDPIWNLMMKNIYSIGALQISPEKFRMNIFYADPSPVNYISAVDPATWDQQLTKKVLLQLFHLDQLNSYKDPQNGGDGFFDFVEGITIDPQYGKIIFPSVEPFGKYLYEKLGGGNNYNDPSSYNPNQKKYVYYSLYTDLKSKAQEQSEKNKFVLKGRYKSQSGKGISLGTFNVPKGSVRVRVAGRLLQEGIDYTVNYQSGTVQILDPSIENSNIPIEVSVENNLIFGGQDRRFIGVNINHKINDNFNLGASLINMRERPYTQKASYGQEPVNNTILGLSGNYSTELPFLTRWLNEIPSMRSDVKSNLSIRAEMAYLMPSNPKSTDFDGQTTTYLDDFEATQSTIDIRNVRSWVLASTPLAFVPNGQLHGSAPDDADNLKNGYGRAKLAWYTIDPIFHSQARPDGISSDEISKNSTRQILVNEIFPEQEIPRGESLVQYTLDLAYYPSKKGPYNNNPLKIDAVNATDKWGGIMRGISSTNFEDNNIEYIQFWLLDPYYSGEFQPSSGELVFDLGNISEDILKDGRKQYENGLSSISQQIGVNKTAWGNVPQAQSLVYAFDNNVENRNMQDVGFDGLNDADERIVYTNNLVESPNDPALDNYQYYLNATGGVLNRYLNYNGMQGNTPAIISENNRAGSTTPDVEDVNRDNTMSTVDSYFEYRIPIKGNISRNDKYVSDIREVNVQLANGHNKLSRWIQFKIPVKSSDRKNFGGGGDLRSVTHLRMYLTGFSSDVVLRFGTLDLVRGDWRNYTKTLSTNLDDPSDDETQVQISSVSIQENETRQPIPYKMPPGVYREQINQNNTLVRQNEQSLSLSVCNLEPSDLRGIYKNMNADLRQYKRIKMFLHAESFKNEPLVSGQMVAFIRLGSDFTENYYQVEIPLEVTPSGANTEDLIWPNANVLDIPMEILTQIKAKGISQNSLNELTYYDSDLNLINDAENTPYSMGKNRYAVKGNPSLGNIRSLMLGVKNITTHRLCAEVWFNELRLAELENKGGWASVAAIDMNASDFVNVSVTGRMSTAGFGSIEQKPNERSREQLKQFNAVMNINAGKLLPKKWNIQIPLGLNHLQNISTPEYDPQYEDIRLKDRINTSNNQQQRKAIEKQAENYTLQQGITLLGVKKNLGKNQKSRFYNIENITLNYIYNQLEHHDFEIDNQREENVRTGISYAYSFESSKFEPFKKNKFFSASKYWKWLSDLNLNLLPTSINFASNITRNFSSQQFREVYIEGVDPKLQTGLPELQQRNYMFDWKYGVNYNLTKTLKLGVDVTNNNIVRNYYILQENGDLVMNKNLSIWEDFWNFGESNHYTSEFRLNYELPFDKLPYLSFIKSSYSYSGNYDWQRGSQELARIAGEQINNVQNANKHNFITNLNMDQLYRTIGIKPLSKNSNVKDYILNILAMVKRVGITYSQTQSTFLPGYLNNTEFFTTTPTFGFVLGSQADIRYMAAQRGWITSFEELNTPFIQSKNQNIALVANLQPLSDLQIDLNAQKQYTDNYEDNFTIQNHQYQSLLENRIGNFSISDNMLFSAFTVSNESYSEDFERFKQNRKTIANRLAKERKIDLNNPDNIDSDGYPKGFGKNNQSVLIPAFYAAYTGRNVEKVSLNAFREIPIPSWNLRYSGLMRLESFRQLFRRFSLTHGYRSSYSLNDFRSNLEYKKQNETDQSGNYRNEMLFTNVNLIEQFSPLIRIDLEMKNTLNILAEIRKERTVSISLDNNYLTEIALKEYRLGVGYRIKDLRISTKFAGENIILKSDLNLKADISMRNNFTVIRNMEFSDNRVTSGQTSWQARFTADYSLSKHLNALYYFDYSFSKYAISTSYPQSTLRTGITIRYTF